MKHDSEFHHRRFIDALLCYVAPRRYVSLQIYSHMALNARRLRTDDVTVKQHMKIYSTELVDEGFPVARLR